MINAENTRISLDPVQYPEDNIASGSNALWSYHKLGTINGVPVRLEDRNLNIDKLADLASAFLLSNQLIVWSGWLSPDYPLDLKTYQNIKQLEALNKCIILLHQLQYSGSKDAYLALITYTNILFRLNNRYSFYKLDLIHE